MQAPPAAPTGFHVALTALREHAAIEIAIGLFVALVAVALLLSRFAPHRRRKIRVAVVFFLFFAATTALAGGLAFLGDTELAKRTFAVSELLQHFVAIELTAIVVFYLVLVRLNVGVPDIARDLSVAIAYGVAVMVLLARFGVQISSLLAASGVVTVIVGLSLQTTLGNILGGVALQLDGSISAGDWIRLPDHTEGKVLQVRWRHTVVETRNWDTVIVPNSELLKQNILILGKREGQPVQHRMWVYFQVDYRFSPERVIEVVTEALRGAVIDGVAQTPPANVIVYDLAREGRPSVNYYAVRYWLNDLPNDDPTNARIMLRVYAALQRADIPLALPAQTVFVTEEDAERKQQKKLEEDRKRAERLARLELFKGLTAEERLTIATGLRYAPFCRGEVITRQGAQAHWLYILSSGRAEIRVRNERGEDAHVADVEAPNIVGEMGLLTGEPRRATVVAATSVECYRLDKDVFRQILEARPEIAEDVSKVLAQREVELRAVRDHLDDAGRHSLVHEERRRILESVKRFFGLAPDSERPLLS